MAQPKNQMAQPNNDNSDANRLVAIDEEIDFEYFVAIDFGTHGTGLGFAVAKTQQIYSEQLWNKDPDIKNKTDILLDANGKFIAFGYQALEQYKRQDDVSSSDDDDDDDSDNDDDYDDDKTDDDEDSDNDLASSPMLFESFKMSLYEKNDNDGDIRDQIQCVDGRMFKTAIVFEEALRFMKGEIFKLFKKNNINLEMNNPEHLKKIQWILTVPAIWSDRAKYKMETWATKAGLISPNVHNHIRIVYEPDCASIHCQYETQDRMAKMSINSNNNDDNDNKSNNKFSIGERYVLIDAGGGTVDIACHQVVKEDDMLAKKKKNTAYQGYCMEEIHHPTGGPWGSDFIDEYFVELLYELFTKEAIDKYKTKHASQYTTIKDNFRTAKCSFYSTTNTSNNNTHSVTVGLEFMQFIPEYLANKNDQPIPTDMIEAFNTIIDKSRPYGKHGLITVDADRLCISYIIWKEHLFDQVINPLREHIRDLLDNRVSDVKYLMLAGGLSSSKYFQDQIHDSFGINSNYKLAIRIPKRPILSVIEGALKLGLVPNYIMGRRLKFTYGIAVDRSIKNVKKYIDKLPPKYVDKNSYIHPLTSKKTVKGLFSVFAKKNQLIKKDQSVTRPYRRFHKNERSCNISIYCSDKPDPYVVSGKPLASVKIQFDDKDNDLPFKVEFFFGDTQISAKCKNKKLQLEYHFYNDPVNV